MMFIEAAFAECSAIAVSSGSADDPGSSLSPASSLSRRAGSPANHTISVAGIHASHDGRVYDTVSV